MDPFSIALLGSSVLSGVSSLLGGFGSSAAAAAQAQQAQINAGIAKTRSVEQAEQSQLQLRQTLGNLTTLQNARGVSTDSPTADAITNYTQTQSDRQEAIGRLNDLNQAQGYEDQAAGYQTTSDMAIPLGLLQGGAAIGSGVAQYYRWAR